MPLYDGGYQIRSWIYVLDHVQAIESLLTKGKSGEVYNITAWNEITNKTIVEKILKLMQKPLDLIEKVGDRPGHDKRYSIDASKKYKKQLAGNQNMNLIKLYKKLSNGIKIIHNGGNHLLMKKHSTHSLGP